MDELKETLNTDGWDDVLDSFQRQCHGIMRAAAMNGTVPVQGMQALYNVLVDIYNKASMSVPQDIKEAFFRD